MNSRNPAAAIIAALGLTAVTSYWGAHTGSIAGAYGKMRFYNPSLFVQTGFNTPGQGYLQPVGSGWPPKASVEVFVTAEPLRDSSGRYAGTSSTLRSIAIYTADSFGSFGYIPPTQYPVAGNICGMPPQGLGRLIFLAKDSANSLLVTSSGDPSIYFTYVPC